MSLNPFRRKSKAELARERVEEARRRLAEAIEQAERLAEPVPTGPRRPLALALSAAAVAGALAWLRSRRSSSEDLPQPDVTPTAPAGPTAERLNDPALKAKVESELFADGDVPKGKLSIDAADGVITLRGTLDDSEQAGELTRAVESIEGVRRVENQTTAGA